jgi:hypothetical protein
VRRAAAVELIGPDGKRAGSLSIGSDGPETLPCDAAGQTRLRLMHSNDQSGFFLIDANGDTRLGAALFAHGGAGYALSRS